MTRTAVKVRHGRTKRSLKTEEESLPLSSWGLFFGIWTSVLTCILVGALIKAHISSLAGANHTGLPPSGRMQDWIRLDHPRSGNLSMACVEDGGLLLGCAAATPNLAVGASCLLKRPDLNGTVGGHASGRHWIEAVQGSHHGQLLLTSESGSLYKVLC